MWPGPPPRYAIALGPLSLVVIGEVMNDASKYPYIVAVDRGGLPIGAFFNFYMEVPAALVYVILGLLVASVAVFTTAASLAVIRR